MQQCWSFLPRSESWHLGLWKELSPFPTSPKKFFPEVPFSLTMLLAISAIQDPSEKLFSMTGDIVKYPL